MTGIQEWTGEAKGKTVHEFFSQIETLARVSEWMNEDESLIVKAKLQGLALQFLSGRRGELVRDGCRYEDLKQALVDRFSDKLPDQYYWTRLQDATRENTTENLTQDPDFEPYHHSRTRASNYEATEIQEGRSELPTHPVGNQAGEYHRDVDDSPQVSEGDGGTVSEPLCTEQVELESTPNEPLEVEDVTNACERAEITPRYNLRRRPGRNV